MLVFSIGLLCDSMSYLLVSTLYCQVMMFEKLIANLLDQCCHFNENCLHEEKSTFTCHHIQVIMKLLYSNTLYQASDISPCKL
ncbi:hypothetical protein F4810DRAFT_681298 [Camillea tinctor]|nr:hypothetical protein F4810DRAFT_681298 [Camillea tinctor]